STFEDAIERGVGRGGKRVGLLMEEWDGTAFPANLRFMDTMHSVEIRVYMYPGELSDVSLSRYFYLSSQFKTYAMS
ncbi:hypothetical protein HDU80_001304, partial [Chytriomyces hyalinus]